MNNPTFTINLDENKQIEFNLNGGARGLQGIQGIAGVSPIVTLDKQGSNLTITVTDAEGTKSETITPGDMFKSTYDTNNNGRVDNADRVNNHTVEKDVPSNAVFTDTVYDDTEVRSNIVILTNTKADKTDTYTKSDVNELISDYSLITETGNKINLEINGSTYVLTAKLYDKNNNLISTSTGIDLPLETMVVGASYDSATKEIVLTLKNGQTTRFSVADLVSGLQEEITSSNKLSADLVDDSTSTNKFVTTSEKTTWNNKIDSSALTNYVQKTDYATSSVGGVIKGNVNGFLVNESGIPYGDIRTYSNYSGAGNILFISKGTLENVITGKDLTTKSYVDGLVGDINTALDLINGESI